MSKLVIPDLNKTVTCKRYTNNVFPFALHVGRIDKFDDNTTAAKAYDQQDGNIFVVFKSVTPGLVAHECMHVVQYLGAYLEEDFTGETEAYLLQWCVERVHKYLERS